MEFEVPLTRLSRRPKQLNEELLVLDQETMRLEKFDGLMASSQLCWPELIRASDWLPIARHLDSTEQQPMFEALDHTHWVLGLAMAHYDNLARTLLERPGRYGSLSSAGCSSATSSGSFGSKRSGRPSRLRLAGRKTLLDGDAKRVGDERNADAC